MGAWRASRTEIQTLCRTLNRTETQKEAPIDCQKNTVVVERTDARTDSSSQQNTNPSRVAVTDKIVYLMRGLPSCGKSRRARELAGTMGVVCETDDFFYSQVGDRADKYDYDADRQQEARDWNYGRFIDAVDCGVTPIVVDRGNGLNFETQRYARYAVDRGYTVLLAEPDSPWWQEIRVLLKYKEHTQPVLDDWADALAKKNRSTHRTPARTIRRWMKHWNSNVTVDAILKYKESKE